jgi:hypothetical protein
VLGAVYEQYLGHVAEVMKQRAKDAQMKMQLGHAVETYTLTAKKERRKEHGIYYTPKFVTDFIVRETVGRFLQENAGYPDKLHNIKILDPACGSGSFLIRAYDELLKYHARELKKPLDKLDQWERLPILTNSIFGVDLDKQAMEITRLNLLLRSLAHREPLPFLGDNIKQGNSLISGTDEELEKYFGTGWQSQHAFNWQDEFSGVMDKGGFDIVIGNPPYIFSRDNLTNSDKEFFKQYYSLTQFKINLYILFIERAFNILNKNGYLAFIIPNNWLTLSTASDLRHFLLTNTFDTHIILNLDKVFAEASVDTCILIFGKTGNPMISSYQWTENGVDMIGSHHPDFYLKKEGYILSGLDDANLDERSKLCDKVNAQSIRLSEICNVKNGVQAYTVGEGHPPQTEDMKNNRVYHNKSKQDAKWIKYFDGVDVGRYKIGWSGQFIKYGDNLSRPRTPNLFKGNRLLIRQIPGQPPYCIYACYVDEDAVNDNNSMIINTDSKKVYLKFVLSILNSKLISFWFIHTFGKLQRAIFPQFKVKELRNFPIKIISTSEQLPFVAIVNKILLTKSKEPLVDVSKLEYQIDQLVYQLYGLTPEEIAVVEERNK